jgi:hypothetical protein
MRLGFLLAWLLVWTVGSTGAQEPQDIADLSARTLFAQDDARLKALKALAERGDPDVLATLILSLRYRNDYEDEVIKTIRAVTGDDSLDDWFSTMIWQEAHPDVIPHESYRDIKLALFKRIDPQFGRFLDGDLSLRENLKIRLEEITWGGVRVDGIPSLDHPKRIKASEADYLKSDDLVFGVSINGDARAYPLRIMGWHEMFNEVIGGVPVALAYCTLCGSGILFETLVPPREKPLIFGSSGFLYRSNKLMFDRETDSLWNQFTGKPVSGPLKDSGIELKIRPVVITTWKDWSDRHPDTTVLSLDTGHRRDYGSGVVYKAYFDSPDLMFPAIVANEKQVQRKDYVFGVRTAGGAKAWPLAAFDGGKVINDTVGLKNVVLVGDAAGRTVRTYERGDREFTAGLDGSSLSGPGGMWRISEDALIGPGGERLGRVAGHIAYWFAWDGYLGNRSELYQITR